VLDATYVDHSSLKIQSGRTPPRPKSRRSKIRNGYCLPALRAITGAKGFILRQFPTLNLAAISCGSSRDSIAAAVTILKVEDGTLLADVLAGRAPLAETARSLKHAVALIDAFQRASSAERRIFGRVVTAGAVFDAIV
jgi:hypothetical protein